MFSNGCGCVNQFFRCENLRHRPWKKKRNVNIQSKSSYVSKDTAICQDIRDLDNEILNPRNKISNSYGDRVMDELDANETSNEIPQETDSQAQDDNSSYSTSTACTTIQVDPSKITIHHEANSEDSLVESPNCNGNAMWSPSSQRRSLQSSSQNHFQKDEYIESSSSIQSVKQVTQETIRETSPSIWQPFGEPVEVVPQFRSVKLGKPTKKHKHTSLSKSTTDTPKKEESTTPTEVGTTIKKDETSETAISTTSNGHMTADERETTTTSSSTTIRTGRISNLPPSQSPTITLLQKAREGQIPKGAIYIEEKPEEKGPLLPKNAILIDQKVTIEGDKVHTDSYYAVPTSVQTGESSTQIIKAPPKHEGIGPTEYGIPISLRTGVKDEYGSDWYKTMYRSLHKNPVGSRGYTQTVHLGGYMSEPEFERKDHRRQTSDPGRREKKDVSFSEEIIVKPKPVEEPVKNTIDSYVFEAAASGREKELPYKNQPRSIAEYEPGNSSLADREFQKFWDEFWESMEDLQEHFRHSPRPQRSYEKKWPNAILCDGYESDSMLIRKSVRPPTQVDPDQQKSWYKEIQKGGEIPFTGLRKSAPAKPKDSPHQYQEGEVNIHYKTPIRNLEKEFIEEEELRKRQEDAMRRFYAEEREKKVQQQVTELEMRRHCDNFTPSQKSPIPLNRYENPFETYYWSRLSPSLDTQRTLAQVLFPFVAQSTREISLNKDDIVYINKQIDKNWYEGEHHGFVGIFPVSYVTVIPTEKANFHPRDVNEGSALVKYNFRAKTPMELSLFKGERVILTKRIDQNWYEGRLGTKKGIFPASYVDVMQPVSRVLVHDRSLTNIPKPLVSPTHAFTENGPLSRQITKSSTFTGTFHDNQVTNRKEADKFSLGDSLHVDTYNEPIPYRSLYSYFPQNEDELELKEGDTVYVMEKCDDGWYVGTSLRTGLFGTFPGNYVERI